MKAANSDGVWNEEGARLHTTIRPPWWRSLLCFILINLLMLMSDFLETHKIGSIFFLSLAILVNADLKNRDVEERAEQ